MAAKGLKPAMARPSARDALAAIDTIAQQSGLPPATMAQSASGDPLAPAPPRLAREGRRSQTAPWLPGEARSAGQSYRWRRAHLAPTASPWLASNLSLPS